MRRLLTLREKEREPVGMKDMYVRRTGAFADGRCSGLPGRVPLLTKLGN